MRAQIWRNCRTYNEEPHGILGMCTKTEQLVDKLWREAGLEGPDCSPLCRRPVQGTKRKEQPESAALPATQQGPAKKRKITVVMSDDTPERQAENRRSRSGKAYSWR